MSPMRQSVAEPADMRIFGACGNRSDTRGERFGYPRSSGPQGARASRIDAACVSHCKCAYAIAGPAFGPVWPWACNISGHKSKAPKEKVLRSRRGPEQATSKKEIRHETHHSNRSLH